MHDDRALRELEALARAAGVTVYTDFEGDAWADGAWEKADRDSMRLLIGSVLLTVVVLVLAIMGALS